MFAGVITKAVILQLQQQINKLIVGAKQPITDRFSPFNQSNKLTYSVTEVSNLLGFSRTSVYEAVRTGQIPSVTFGRRIFVPRVTLEKMLNKG